MSTAPFLTPELSPQWEAFVQSLEGIELISNPDQVARLSQDWHSLSPVLSRQLGHKRGDLVVCPRTQTEVLRVAQVCVAYRVPVTVRGGGMANYGQAVPLQGGIVLDMSRMQEIRWLKPGIARVEAGIKPITLEKAARQMGWEMRLLPSTLRTATIGGFVAGGGGGIWSITYGGLKARGNLLGLQVVTLEDEPRLLELRGDELPKVNHSWGLNGIITEVELPLAPAIPWAEAIVAFDDLLTAVEFGYEVAHCDGIPKRLLSLQAWPIPTFFPPFREHIPEGSHCIQVIYAEPSLEALKGLIDQYEGLLCWQKGSDPQIKGPTLMEYCFNHTVLHARAVDTGITAIQGSFPAAEGLQRVRQLVEHFGDEVMMHFEYMRRDGQITGGSGHLVRFTGEDRLKEMMHYEQSQGIMGPNVHSYLIEEVGRSTPEAVLAFKKQTDPYGLLNPGKTRFAMSEM